MKDHCVRFKPAEVEGMPDVAEVTIFPNQLVVTSTEQPQIFRFDSFAKSQESFVKRWLQRLWGQAPLPLVVGEREFCTSRRYVTFYTNPRLKIFTPPDADAPYEETFIFRINAVLRIGGYITYDLS